MIHLERKTKKIYQNISISVPWTNSSESTARRPNCPLKEKPFELGQSTI